MEPSALIMVNILYDGEWNPQVDLLAQDCAHSFGQTEQAMVYRPLTKVVQTPRLTAGRTCGE